MSPRWSPSGRPVSRRVEGGQGAMPSARERRRANPVLVSAGFRDCADFEIVRRFRILRGLVQPNLLTQLDTPRDFEISTKSRSWGQPNPGGFPGCAVSAASSVPSSLFAAQLVPCCWVGGTQDAGPSARERRRANPVLASKGFRICADFEIVRRFRILRDLVRPNPPAQLDIVRDFEISTKSYS